MDVHLRDLRYFVRVAELLHFGRAAEALFVSQPALSKQIRALETQLRTVLFERDRRTVRLTAAGAALLPAARTVLEGWERAETALAAAAVTAEATLVVGMSTGLGRGLLPAVRARFAERAPRARLRIRQIPWDDPTGGLAGAGGDRTDAAFVWLPLPEPHRYRVLPVATEPRRLLLPAGHPLAARDVVAFAELLDESFLALPAAAGSLRDYWLATEARGGRRVVVGAEIATTDETVEALVAGLGVSLVAAGNVDLFRHPGIAVRDVSGVAPSELVLAWRREDERPLLQTFVTTVAAVTTGS